ncbi:hypothetical protein AR9_g261 [Bacillus phage AR9]|uniref:Uncharacterized protein n=2 Tax=Bacillus phage PBS1 TaxID=10683 RepID=A0A172JIF4_BPPB1|nr:hypothetical protein BI022_gp260 [Bacillus phage AR9]YP_009664355.1 hypothetical protein FK780_gp293 [Bacillus phage PBS1]WCS68390.1 hypothetical protein Goe21_02810 [Bacillus phage vB_BsuM-Goe21]AMS01345.1 hypothetical protein AR9_g261 [Bacillus phage AR9]AST99975.1 hypothetical protein PBI_PBS1_154 [Bacillus phage PBS1]BDE75509.1 hypothetical protein [Bacillus phage PBS1]
MIKKINSPAKVNNIVNIQSVQNNDNILLKNMDGYFQEKFYFTDIYDDTKMKKLVGSIKSQIRSSDEYSHYIGFLKNELGLSHCAVLGNVSAEDASLEFHHYPFTIHDIINLSISRNILLGKKFNSFTIIKEVLDDHYNNIIGLVPLSLTVHELVHAGEIFVNLNQVYGDINEFNKKYSFAMTDDMIEKFNKLIELSESNAPYSETNILKKIYDKIEDNDRT